jgi:hypothetical protein
MRHSIIALSTRRTTRALNDTSRLPLLLLSLSLSLAIDSGKRAASFLDARSFVRSFVRSLFVCLFVIYSHGKSRIDDCKSFPTRRSKRRKASLRTRIRARYAPEIYQIPLREA